MKSQRSWKASRLLEHRCYRNSFKNHQSPALAGHHPCWPIPKMSIQRRKVMVLDCETVSILQQTFVDRYMKNPRCWDITAHQQPPFWQRNRKKVLSETRGMGTSTPACSQKATAEIPGLFCMLVDARCHASEAVIQHESSAGSRGGGRLVSLFIG